MSTFEEILSKDGKLVYKTKGVSMNPMLYQNRDLVVIVPVKERLKKYDVALYRRGKSYVLHRVIEVNDDGTYLIRGDNTYSDEIVPDSAVLGVLTEFVRDGKQYKVTESRSSSAGIPGQNRAELNRTELNRAELNRTELNRTELNRTELNRTELNKSGLN